MPPNVITDEKVHQVVCCFLIFMISTFLVLLMTPGSLLMMVSLPFTGPSSSYGVTVQWWSQLGQTRDDNVVLLPGVSLTEAQEFVDILYGRDKVSNRHFTVIEDTGVTDEDINNNNISDDGDIKLLLINVFMNIEKTFLICKATQEQKIC